MGTYAKFKNRKEIEPGIYQITNEIYHDGACQCFGDCECMQRRGEILGLDERYTYEGAVHKGTGRCRTFNSLRGCKESMKSKTPKPEES